MLPPPPPTAAARFAAIIRLLCRLLAESLPRGPLSSRQGIALTGRLCRIGQQFSRLAARFAAGTLRPPRPYVPRPRRAAAPHAEPPPPRRLAPDALPRGRAWLVRAVRSTSVCGSQLAHLVANDPEMIALLQAAPQARRLLRPLFRMLGAPLPAILAPPPRPVPRAAPAPRPPSQMPPVALPGRLPPARIALRPPRAKPA